jgi:PAS domain S-box-containing protein
MNNHDLLANHLEGIHLLEKALYSLQDGVTILNREGIIVYINSSARKEFQKQMNMAPCVGDNFLAFVKKERLNLFIQYISRALNNESSIYQLHNNNHGHETWFEINVYPIAEDGIVSHVCIKAREITERILMEKKFEKERREQKNQIMKAIIDAQEKERNQMGRELHDNVNQVLTTVKLYQEICLMDENPNKEMMGKSLEQINYCIGELRKISKQLSPPTIDEVSLKELIVDLIHSINVTSKIDVRLYTFGIKQDKLNEGIQTAIYRIAQEQLTNVLKYAYASEVEIFLVGTAENIALKIQDNGVGFNPQKKRRGIGIANIRNRAETLGGRFELISSPGSGCTLMVEIPL